MVQIQPKLPTSARAPTEEGGLEGEKKTDIENLANETHGGGKPTSLVTTCLITRQALFTLTGLITHFEEDSKIMPSYTLYTMGVLYNYITTNVTIDKRERIVVNK